MKINSYPLFLDDKTFIEFWDSYINNHERIDDSLSLYIHFPWCRSRCKYCVFGGNKYDKSKNIIEKYEKKVINVIKNINKILYNKNIDEIFFGGGTASLWTFDSLLQMRDALDCYNNIKIKKMEIHPSDLSDELLYIYINKMGFDHVSIGVESFDRDSNINQKRIPVDIDKLSNYVKQFRSSGVYVNIDLVALFNGEDEYNWNIFKNDIDKAINIVKPDSISVYMNYNSADFFNNSIKLRKLLSSIDGNAGYRSYHVGILSLDMNDIISYGSAPYVLANDKYNNYINYIKSLGLSVEEYQNIIGVGGINMNEAISKTIDGHIIHASFQSCSNSFSYFVNKSSKNVNCNNICIGRRIINIPHCE